MNLAFLGYFANKEVFTKKILFHWPDGIWLKKHIQIEKNTWKRFNKKFKNSKKNKK